MTPRIHPGERLNFQPPTKYCNSRVFGDNSWVRLVVKRNAQFARNNFPHLSKPLHPKLWFHCKNYKEVNGKKSWAHPLHSNLHHPDDYPNKYIRWKHAPGNTGFFTDLANSSGQNRIAEQAIRLVPLQASTLGLPVNPAALTRKVGLCSRIQEDKRSMIE